MAGAGATCCPCSEVREPEFTILGNLTSLPYPAAILSLCFPFTIQAFRPPLMEDVWSEGNLKSKMSIRFLLVGPGADSRTCPDQQEDPEFIDSRITLYFRSRLRFPIPLGGYKIIPFTLVPLDLAPDANCPERDQRPIFNHPHEKPRRLEEV